MMLTLNNVYTIGGNAPVSIGINKGKIVYTDRQLLGGQELFFNEALVIPGLINSHDHLDFNLFPQLGYQKYSSYKAWGDHIHTHYKKEIDAVLNIPPKLRIAWGIYKNLLCGVTTVVNHGERLNLQSPLISVIESGQSIHSVGFERRWIWRLNNPLKINTKAIIHAGEGTNAEALSEIRQLLQWNILKREIVVVHGVALPVSLARKFSALVWCPASNNFLLGQTARVSELKHHLPILFGTDSTLTGVWDIWQHIRHARQTGLLTDGELWNSLNTMPASAWQIDTGIIAQGYDADLIVVKRKTEDTHIQTALATTPEDILLVIHKGDIRLLDEMLYPQLTYIKQGGFSKIKIDRKYKYVAGDLPLLIEKISHYYPGAAFPVSAA